MKKFNEQSFKVFGITVMVMFTLFLCCFWYLDYQHRVELTEVKNAQIEKYNILAKEYNELVSEYEELDSEMQDLSTEVYRMMEGSNDYEFTLDFGNTSHTYISEPDGWFTNKRHITTTIN